VCRHQRREFMSFTAFAIIWLPLLGAAVWNRGALIAMVAMSAVFDSAAVINIGSGEGARPISPYYFTAATCAALVIGRIVRGKGRLLVVSRLHVSLMLLVGFALYSSFSLTLPMLFEDLEVYGPRLSYAEGYEQLVPAKLSISMIGQLGYLILNLFVFVFLVASPRGGRVEASLIRGILASGGVVCFLGLWQFISRITGLYFPEELFHNAAGRALFTSSTLGGAPRINGPFTEASYAAAYLVGFIAFAVRLWLARRHVLVGSLALTATLVLLLTTSSTGYIAISLVVGAFAAEFVLLPILRRGVVPRRSLFVIVAMFLIALFLSALFVLPIVRDIFELTITDKVLGTSFQHRIASDSRALLIVFETYGLGIGIGGNVASSFLMQIASNVGVFGTVLFFGVLISLSSSALSASARAGDRMRTDLVIAAIYGLWAHVVARVIAVPSFSFPPLWIWICLVAVVAAQTQTLRKEYSN
jgi:hypothetical protein